MSSHFENLNRAARLLRRIADVGEVSEFEGVSMVEIVGDVLMAANAVHVREAADALVFRCSPDESAGIEEFASLKEEFASLKEQEDKPLGLPRPVTSCSLSDADIESAGMAEVIEMQSYSRKAPCV